MILIDGSADAWLSPGHSENDDSSLAIRRYSTVRSVWVLAGADVDGG